MQTAPRMGQRSTRKAASRTGSGRTQPRAALRCFRRRSSPLDEPRGQTTAEAQRTEGKVLHRTSGANRLVAGGEKRAVVPMGVDAARAPIGRSARPPRRISKCGSWPAGAGRGRLVSRPTTGPLCAFYGRIKACRGHGKAIVAAARKLAVLFCCLLSRGEDYTHQQSSLTARKLRRLEVAAGAPRREGKLCGVWATRERMRQAEKQLADQRAGGRRDPSRSWVSADLHGSVLPAAVPGGSVECSAPHRLPLRVCQSRVSVVAVTGDTIRLQRRVFRFLR